MSKTMLKVPISWLYGLAVVICVVLGEVTTCPEPQWELQKSVLQQTGGHLPFVLVVFSWSHVLNKRKVILCSTKIATKENIL